MLPLLENAPSEFERNESSYWWIECSINSHSIRLIDSAVCLTVSLWIVCILGNLPMTAKLLRSLAMTVGISPLCYF